MADGAPTAPRVERGLTYPLPAPPEAGRAVSVAPDVLWMRLPLPFSLDHINVWAIRDGAGWALVDTGLNTSRVTDQWEALLAGPLEGRPVTRVICTHMHPDHIGLAGWLCRRFDAPLLMSRLEYVTARMLLADTGRPAPEEGVRFYRAAGWCDARIQTYRDTFGRFGSAVSPMPDSYLRLVEGQDLRIGEDEWRIVMGNGHSPEHACLWRRSDGLFIAGDQVLPKISSNVSTWPTEPEADPLGDWLASIERLRSLLPADLLILPAHGEPFVGVHERLDALARGHAVGLTRLERTLREPRRAVDVFPALFARPVDSRNYGMATGEALAHLNRLAAEGRAERRRDADGVDWWTATDRGKPA